MFFVFNCKDNVYFHTLYRNKQKNDIKLKSFLFNLHRKKHGIIVNTCNVYS